MTICSLQQADVSIRKKPIHFAHMTEKRVSKLANMKYVYASAEICVCSLESILTIITRYFAAVYLKTFVKFLSS